MKLNSSSSHRKATVSEESYMVQKEVLLYWKSFKFTAISVFVTTRKSVYV